MVDFLALVAQEIQTCINALASQGGTIRHGATVNAEWPQYARKNAKIPNACQIEMSWWGSLEVFSCSVLIGKEG